MKHAGPDTLRALSEVLQLIRTRTQLAERRPGVFYHRGKAFLHFHEDAAGLFADLKDGEWRRFPVSRAGEPKRLLAAVDKVLKRN